MRVSHYNSALLSTICKNIDQGLSNKDSALLAGISESTFYLWQSDKPNNPLTKNQKLEFLESLKKAKLKRKKKLIAKIYQAANTKWQAAAWYLERVYPKEFGKKNPSLLKNHESLAPSKIKIIHSCKHNE